MIEFETDLGKIRLLLNDVDETKLVFLDEELEAFLDLEGGSVKLAAAQAIDTNATNIVLAMRVLRSQDLTTDGAKVADAMRAHADRLRAQSEEEDGGFFEIVDATRRCRPELTERPTTWSTARSW